MTSVYSLGMRLLTPLVAVALVALLAACGPEPVPAPLPPEPTATAVFASDAEALAAAEEAYAAYLEMSDIVTADGGQGAHRLEPFVDPDYFASTLAAIQIYIERDVHTQGKTEFRVVSLNYFDEFELQMEICLDVTDIRILNAEGLDVTPRDRVNVLPITITLAMGTPLLVRTSHTNEYVDC